MIACDLVNGGFEDNWSIKQKVAAGRPYGDWLAQHAKVKSEGTLFSAGCVVGVTCLVLVNWLAHME